MADLRIALPSRPPGKESGTFLHQLYMCARTFTGVGVPGGIQTLGRPQITRFHREYDGRLRSDRERANRLPRAGVNHHDVLQVRLRCI